MSLNKKLLEQLFLIEILVHKVNVREKNKCDPNCKCKKHSKHRNIPLRVRIKFINFPCVEINQEEFAKKDDDDPGKFGCGKSFLFPMAPLDLIRAIQHFPLAVTVIRKPRANKSPDILGVTQVRLTEDMCDSIRQASVCDEQLPISSELKDAFDIVDLDNEYAGYIVLFVRLSCFGQSITTQFQMMDKRSYLFKNTQPDEPYFCDKCDDNMDEDPRTYDVVPVPPLISSSHDMMDIPCCLEAQFMDDMEKRAVSWKMINASDDSIDLEDNTVFLGKVSDMHATKSPNKKTCSCSGRNKISDYPDSERFKFSNSIDKGPFDTYGLELHSYKTQPYSSQSVKLSVEPASTPNMPDTLPVPPPTPQPPAEDAQEPPPDDTKHPIELRPHTSPAAIQHEETHKAASLSSLDALRMSAEPPQHQDETYTEHVQTKERKASKLRRRFRRSSKYVYSWGTHYPGTKFGHKTCVEPYTRVPENKGWLWNNRTCNYGLKARPGWRPGAIGHSLSHVIRGAPLAVHPLAPPLKHAPRPSSARSPLRGVASKTNAGPVLYSSELVPLPSTPPAEPMPTLHVHRRRGAYYVTMHPPGLSGDSDNIPLQFRIPNKDKKKRPRKEEEEGHADGTLSVAEGSDETLLHDKPDGTQEWTSTSSSELDIEFFAPGAFEPWQPVQLVNTQTQFLEADLPPIKPKSLLDIPMAGDASTKSRASSMKSKGKGKGKSKDKKGKKSKKQSRKSAMDLVLAEIESRSKQVQVNPQELEVGKAIKGRKPTGFVRNPKPPSRTVAWEHDDVINPLGPKRRLQSMPLSIPAK